MLETFDSGLLLWLQENVRNPILTPLMKAVTHLGDAGIFWILLTLVLLILPRTRKVGLGSAIALLGSLVVCNLILKNAVGRIRPYEVIAGLECIVGRAHDASFPSGHTSASFASAVALFRQIPRKYGVPLLILAALIAFSRLYVGIHYPTDVLAGLVIGIALGWFGSKLGPKAYAYLPAKLHREP